MTERTREGLACGAIALMCLLVSLPLASAEGQVATVITALLRLAAFMFGLGGLGMIAWDLLRPDHTKSSSGDRSSGEA